MPRLRRKHWRLTPNVGKQRMKHIKASSFVIPLLCVLTAGCASMGKYDQGYARPFTAIRTDAGMTYHAIAGKPENEEPDPFDFIYSPWFIPLFILDMPFSIITDVVTLPYDLHHLKDLDNSKDRCLKEKKTFPNHGLESTSAPPAAGTPETHP